MSHESQLLDLVVEWEDRRAAGEAPSAEELCGECPELLEAFRARLQALEGMKAVLEAAAESPDRTQLQLHPPPMPANASAACWPSIPGYEILQELGRGGMGAVFQARQLALGRLVAIKAVLAFGPIREVQRRRFLREAQAMAILQHPNIVQIHEIFHQNEHPCIVMEYVEGPSLADHLAGKSLSPRTAAELVAVLARAVQVAHGRGVIHRDLKPGNILLAADGTPKICDFGLARHFDETAQCTQTGQVAGTPSYMAPEQVSGPAASQGPGVDIYALGGVLYACLTGRPAFLADNPLDTMRLVLNQQPVPPGQLQPGTPRDLETICLKCLAKEPPRRYASALELAEDLERYLAGAPIHARPVGPAERAWRWCRTHPSGTALLAVISLAVVVVLAMVLAYNRRLSRELLRTETARQEVLAGQEKLHRTLAQQVADRLDGDLRELSVVPLTLATLLESRQVADDSRLEHILKEMLGKAPLIFGLCVAMEPGAWREDRLDFALYVYRGRKGLAVKQLLLPSYQPHYRQWEWYHKAKDSPRGCWSEPYVGQGADHTPMVTFSAPIRRDGRFVGVVAADLAMDYFRDLRSSLDRLELGAEGYCMLVSAAGQILAHQADRYEFPSPDADLKGLPLDANFRGLTTQWSHATEGRGHAVDFSTGQPASFLFRRIPSSEWTLVLVTD